MKKQLCFTLVIACSILLNAQRQPAVSMMARSSITTHSAAHENKMPTQALENTTMVVSPIDACASSDGSITLLNGGQTIARNIRVTETLTAGLAYVPNSTRWRVNNDPWQGPDPVFDPSPGAFGILWTDAEIPMLDTLHPSSTLEIEFALSTDSMFTGGDVSVASQYQALGQMHVSAPFTFTVGVWEPNINVTQTRGDDPIGCGELIEWTIDVENTSGYALPFLWVQDTLGTAFTFDSAVGDSTYMIDDGHNNGGQVTTWELQNVGHNATASLTLRATTNSAPCNPDLDNEVRVWWGCGTADGNSATKPGVHAPDDDLSLSTDDVSVTLTETRKPDLGFLDITMNPSSIAACTDSTELTIVMENSGPTDAHDVDLVVTLPAGLGYNSGTSEFALGTTSAGAIGELGTIGDPTITGSGSTLTWYDLDSKSSDLADTVQAYDGNDTLVLRFDVPSNCYTTNDIAFDLRFYDCCGDTQYSETATQTLTGLSPDLAVTKTPASGQVACGDPQTWTIEVVNNGSGNAQVVRVVDSLGDWLDSVPASFNDIDVTGAVFTQIGGDSQVVGWEFNYLSAGGTARFTFETTLNPDALPNQADCSAALRQNNVSAQWACGVSGDATDHNPNTTGYDCIDSDSASAEPSTLQMPDLVVTNITPTITCSADGVFGGSIVASVENQGDGDSNDTFRFQVSDGKLFTHTSDYSSSIAAGNWITVSIDTGAWSPGCHACTAPYSFSASADLDNDVCECDESNNAFGPLLYTVPVPDVAVQTDTLTITSRYDDQTTVSGGLTLTNSGCVTVTDDIPIRLILYDAAGCTGDVLEQWTETLSSVNIAPGGGTRAFSITTHSFSANLCHDAASCQLSIQAELDFDDDIAECDGTANVHRVNRSINLPDLAIRKTADPSSAAPGEAITYTLAFSNTGSATAIGVVISDRVPISITNLHYNSNQAVAASGSFSYTWQVQNLPPGQGGVITITGTLRQALAAGVFSNTATISGTTAEAVTTNNSAEVKLTVQNVPPLADDDAFEVWEDSSSNALDVLDGDSDANADALVILAVGAPDNGGSVSHDGDHIFYSPAANFFGSEVLSYTVSDGNDAYDTANVSITVMPVNDAPLAQDNAYATGYDTPLVIEAPGVLENDTDVDGALTATQTNGTLGGGTLGDPLAWGPFSGTLTLDLDGSFSYTPTVGSEGLDHFVYLASDGLLADRATVIIGVGVIPTFTLTVAQDGSGSGTVMPGVGPRVYELDTVVTLTATADVGSEFMGWSGALTSTLNSITLTMTCHLEMACDKAVTASFDQSDRVYLPLVLRR